MKSLAPQQNVEKKQKKKKSKKNVSSK